MYGSIVSLGVLSAGCQISSPRSGSVPAITIRGLRVNNDAFEFFCQGRLAEAIAAYSASITTYPSPLLLSNRALARWRSGDDADAIADYQAAEQLESPAERSDANLKRIASVLWMMGHQEEALAQWEDVLDRAKRHEFRFTDGSGGAHAGLLL